ncbi:hypothetical protein IH879_21405 [candidate division KSB1 bacterium]|nr:hypothetical protein [candidate division KSB1 bacterium]
MKFKKLDLHILIEKEDSIFSALCLELDVASQGGTLNKAKKNIREAIELYLEDVLESGDEKEFIPRSAPVEEWLKYFEVAAKNLKKKILDKSNTAGLRLHQAVYAP